MAETVRGISIRAETPRQIGAWVIQDLRSEARARVSDRSNYRVALIPTAAR